MAAVKIGIHTILKVCRILVKMAGNYRARWGTYLTAQDIEDLDALIHCAEIVLERVTPPEQ